MNITKYLLPLVVLTTAGCASSNKHSSSDVPANTAPQMASTPAPAAPPATATDLAKLTCTKDNETRVLEILKQAPGCTLDYTKHGKMSAVARSSHGTKHCLESEKKIRAKLEHSGYSCG